MFQTVSSKSQQYFDEYQSYMNQNQLGNRHLTQADEQFNFSKNSQILFYKYDSLIKEDKINEGNSKRTFLIIPSFFNSPEIFFLSKEKSFINFLSKLGEIYIIKWLEIEDGKFDFNDYVKEILNILQFIKNVKHVTKPEVIGHCIGGTIALIATSLFPSIIRTLTLLTSPWDFSHLSNIVEIYINICVNENIKKLPIIPKIYIKILFFLLFPEYFKVKMDNYFNLAKDEDKKLFYEMENWLYSGTSIPNSTFFQLLEDIVIKNKLNANEWKINNKTINLNKLNISICLVGAKKDRLVPLSSVLSLQSTLKNSKIIEVDGGHINYLISSKLENFFIEYQAWLERET